MNTLKNYPLIKNLGIHTIKIFLHKKWKNKDILMIKYMIGIYLKMRRIMNWT